MTASGCRKRAPSNSSVLVTNRYEECTYEVQQKARIYEFYCDSDYDRADHLVHKPNERKCTQDEYALCRSYKAAVQLNKTLYQNIHCLKCIANISAVTLPSIRTNKTPKKKLLGVQYSLSISSYNGVPEVQEFCSNKSTMRATILKFEQLKWHSELFKMIVDSVNGKTDQQCQMKQRHSCLYKNPCCSCDPDTCMDNNDCCIDAFFEKEPLPTSKYLATFLEKAEASKASRCLPIVPSLPEGNYVPFVYQINYCGVNSTSGTNETKIKANREYCEGAIRNITNIEMLVPVLGSDKMIYSNKYCAHCNGVNNYEWLQVKASGCSLRNISLIKSNSPTEKYTGCTYFLRGNYPKRLNCVKYPDNQGLCTDYEWDLCKSYKAYVVEDSSWRLYKNVHCLKCSEKLKAFHVDDCKDDGTSGVDRETGYALTMAFLGGSVKIKETSTIMVMESLFIQINQTVKQPNSTEVLNESYPLLRIHNKTYYPAEDLINNMRSIKAIIGKVGASLSITALFITIITYALFKPLRNQPGKILVSLSLAILLSDLIIVNMEYASTKQESCKAVASFLHWSLLCQHLWSTTTIFDIYRTFSSKFRAIPIPFMKISVVTWSIPTLIVLICILLDNILSESIGYGRDGVCWITNHVAQITSYIVPFAISLAANAFMFSVNMVNMNKQQKLSASIKGSSTAREVEKSKLFMKIALLVGLIEILGFIQIPPYNEAAAIANEVVSIVYTLSRGLRGFMIFCCFVAKRKILNMYMGRHKSNTNSASRSSTATITSYARNDKVYTDTRF